jgi:ketosteroid isomerase-like protein
VGHTEPYLNEELVFRAFRAMCAGNTHALNGVLHDDVVLHYPGRSALAGRFEGLQEVVNWMRRTSEYTKRRALTGAWADAERAVALTVSRLERDGKTHYERGITVLGLREGKVDQVWVTPMDLYASDEIWS